MTTERLNILAAALALGEFTAPELAAFTGAKPNTVRGVLHRELARDLFECQAPSGESQGSRATIWRLKDRDAVFGEIEREESSVVNLRHSPDMPGEDSDRRSSERAALLASAERAAAQSCEADDVAEQTAFVTVAANLLKAADLTVGHQGMPDSDVGSGELAASGLDRWKLDLDLLRDPGYLASSMRDSRHSDVLASPGAFASLDDTLIQQVSRTAAFAALAARRASGQRLKAHDLRYAAVAVTASSSKLPRAETVAWLRRIVRVSSSDGSYLPPVAILMRPGQFPQDIFPIVRSEWRCVRAQASLVRPRYTLWAEDWAESLLVADLMPAIIVVDDATLESGDLVDKALADAQRSYASPATIVASIADDLDTITRVSQAGGLFFPLRGTVEGLLETVRNAVAKMVGLAPIKLVSAPVDPRLRDVPVPAAESLAFGRTAAEEGGRHHPITVSRAVGISVSQLEDWTRALLTESDAYQGQNMVLRRWYSFHEVVALKVAKMMHDSGASLEQMRSAVSFVREPGDESLKRMTVISDGVRVYSAMAPHEQASLAPGTVRIAVGGVLREARSAVTEIESELKRRLHSAADVEVYAASASESSMRNELGAIITTDRGRYKPVSLDIDGVASRSGDDDFAEPGQAGDRIPVYIVLDTSARMRKHEQLLNDNVITLIETLLSRPSVREYIRLTIISLDAAPRLLWVMSDEADAVIQRDIVCGGEPNYTAMFALLRDRLNADIPDLANSGVNALQPVVIFVIGDSLAGGWLYSWASKLSDLWCRPYTIAYTLISSSGSIASNIQASAYFEATDQLGNERQTLSSAFTSVLRLLLASAHKKQLQIPEDVSGFKSLLALSRYDQ